MRTSTDAERDDGPWSVRVLGLAQFAVELGMAEVIDTVAARHPGLRPAHLRLFRWGPVDRVRVTELAARSEMTRQSMHELLGHLERCGYLCREPDPADRRAQRVRLSATGRTLQAQVRAASARIHLRWFERLGADRFTTFWAALGEVAERDDPLPDPAELARLVEQDDAEYRAGRTGRSSTDRPATAR
jgi:DNA-binding MarR family transcriptional regulator